jgi:low temperature requirement protein LtrA
MVAGIIVAAVGDELVIAHPTDELASAEVAAVVAGPALYLLGHALFRLRMAGSLSWKRFGGAVACLALGAIGTSVPALVLSTLVLGVLVAVIAAERIGAARRAARGEPAPLERLEASSG